MSDNYFTDSTASDEEKTALENKVKNSAYLVPTYIYGTGIGPGNQSWLKFALNKDPVLPGSIGKTISVAQKTGTSYSPADQSMTYTISVNPGGVDLQDGVEVTVSQQQNTIYWWELTKTEAEMKSIVEAAITALNSTLAPDKQVTMEESSFSQTTNAGLTTFTFKLNNLHRNSFSFDVPAKVTDPDYYAKNHTKKEETDKFRLKAEAKYMVVGNTTQKSQYETASITASSTVLKKEALSYLAVQEATNSHDFKRSGELNEVWTKITDVPDWLKYEK